MRINGRVEDPSGAPRSRRDFLTIGASGFAAVGLAAAAWPFVAQMSPAADTSASVVVDLAEIELGRRKTVHWPGRLIYISHRTPEEIASAKAVDRMSLIDPVSDVARVRRDEWLIVEGLCTFERWRCELLGQPAIEYRRTSNYGSWRSISLEHRGGWGGWACPCCGSEYDTAGRVRRGPATRNLAIPNYEFMRDGWLLLG